MTDLFLDILNLSFSAAWVVLAVVLARLLLKRAPRWLVCGLWAVVALRLVFGGIEAPFSLIPSSELIPTESLFDQAPVIHSGVSSIDNIVNPIYSESLRPTPGASVNPLQVWLAVFANFWVLGMIAMTAWAAISCHRVRRKVRESIPAEEGVFLCDRLASPFIFGLFRPKIYLPSDLGEGSRSYVIAHERAHLARRDHWWKPLGFLLLTIHWFNPLMWLAYVLLCRDIELACDERVIRNYGAEEKKSYSAALLCCSVNPRRITTCPLAFGEVGVKQRIRSVLHYKKPAFWVVLIAFAVCIALAVGFLTDPVTEPAESQTDDPSQVTTQTFTFDNIILTADIPNGWETEAIHGSGYCGFQFRSEEDRSGGWVSVKYWPNRVILIDYSGIVRETTFLSGMAAEIYYFDEHDEERGYWDMVYFYGDSSCMSVEKPENYLWDDIYHHETLNIIGTITVTEDGRNVFAEQDLGITLSVENVTPAGLTLVCTQDRTPWSEIITGSPWSLEQKTVDGWVSVMPESTVWTTIAYSVNQNDVTRWGIDWSQIVGQLPPGTYRVGKHFTGTPVPPPWLDATRKSVDQTCYAEFTIE